MVMLQCHMGKQYGESYHPLSAPGKLIGVSEHWDNKSSKILANNLLFLNSAEE